MNLFWSARLLNTLLIGVLIWQSAFLARVYLTSRLMLSLFLLLLTCSGVALSVGVFAWTELLFLVFVVLAIRLLIGYIHQRHWRYLVALMTVVALASMTRYVGVALAGTVAVTILLERGVTRHQRAVVAASFLGGALMPPLIWLIRNWMVTGALFGTRDANLNSLIDQVVSMGYALSSWLVTFIIPFRTRLVIAGVVTASVLYTAWRVRSATTRTGNRTPWSILTVFIVSYCLLVIPLTILSTNQTVDERYLFVLYPFLLITFFFALEKVYLRIRHNVVLVTPFLLIILFNSLLLTARGIAIVSYGQVHGFGLYPKRPWQVPRFVQKLSALPSPGTIYSNYPLQLYLSTGRATKFSPMQNQALASEFFATQQHPRYLVWFETTEENPKPVQGIDWLKSNFTLIPRIVQPPENGLIGWTAYSF
jgi:4-amino-4-deoxy-L-arabinose transferase-like glycosyltransferase